MAYFIQFGNGPQLRLKPQTRKTGKGTYLVVTDGRPVSMFGINVPIAAVGGKLPSDAKLFEDDKLLRTIKLESGATTGDPKTGKGGGKPKRSASVDQAVEHEGDKCALQIRVTTPQTSTANLLVRTVKPREASVVDLSSLA